MLGKERILYPRDAEPQEIFAAKELRRYLYLRTGNLLSVVSEDRLPEGEDGFVVGYADRKLITDMNGDFAVDFSGDGGQHYGLKTLVCHGGKWVVATGGRQGGLLYAVYQLAEHYGIRYSLHGDIVPDRRIPLTLVEVSEHGEPLFELRGILPFHDFPEGPDWWNEDDYKSVLAQLPKLKMNFIGLHTYPEWPRTNTHANAEPTTWIGLPEDVGDDGIVKHSYPSRHYTTFNGTWGYKAMGTGTFTNGGKALFERDDYSADYMQGMGPWPETMTNSNELFRRFGKLLKSVFAYARGLGVSTCLGVEAPLTIPEEVKRRLLDKGLDPTDPSTVKQLYEGIFTRIKKTHPLDYFWLWTPETWTWGGNSVEQTEAVMRDIQIAAEVAKEVGNIQIATCGWVLGPQSDRTRFDRELPKEVPFSCINRQFGFDSVDPGFHTIRDRPTWAIPWVEDDPAMNLPQLWGGRIRRDAADAAAYGCNGLMGIHWRTKVVGPTVSALALAGWKQREWNPAFGEPAVAIADCAEGVVGGRKVKIGSLEKSSYGAEYETARVGMSKYRVQVPNGIYNVKLKFLEWEAYGNDLRLFDILTNGRIENTIHYLDIYAASGSNAPLERTIHHWKVFDGKLELAFKPQFGEAAICAIEIEGVTDKTNSIEGIAYTRHINCGGMATGIHEADLPDLNERDRELPIASFYEDWAIAQFGPDAAADIAAIFTEMDGKLPRPITWTAGPGSTIIANRTNWAIAKSQYDFVERLERLRERVNGIGERERLDYWLAQFRYLRAAGRVGCLLGEYEAANDSISEEATEESKRELAKVKLLPLRKELVHAYDEMNAHLLATVSTPGELGTFANVQLQTMQSQLHTPGKALAQLLGEPLPADCCPSMDYTGDPRLIVPTVRTSIREGELLVLKAMLLGAKPESLKLHWKPLASQAYMTQAFEHVNRGVYRVLLRLPEPYEDIEYYVEAITDAGLLRYPATAPELNQTVVICPERD